MSTLLKRTRLKRTLAGVRFNLVRINKEDWLLDVWLWSLKGYTTFPFSAMTSAGLTTHSVVVARRSRHHEYRSWLMEAPDC